MLLAGQINASNRHLVGGTFTAAGLLYLIVGKGFRSLNRLVRIPGAFLACIGLIGFPVGTIINGYILYLLLSPKTQTVFSVEYKKVIASTPHVRHSSTFGKILVIVFIVIAIFAFVGVLTTLVANLIRGGRA